MDYDTCSTASSESEASIETVNYQEPNLKNTALHIAVESDDLTSAKELLRSGSDTDIKNSFGETPLVSPSIRRDTKAFALLVEAGANLTKTNDVNEPIESLTQNKTILEIAKQSNQIDNDYLEATKNPSKANIQVLKEDLSKSSEVVWNPYKRLATKIGNDTNGDDMSLKINSTKIFKSIISDQAHKEPMQHASEEISERLLNQGNASLSNLIETSRTPRWYDQLLNKRVSSSYVQSKEESNASASRFI